MQTRRRRVHAGAMRRLGFTLIELMIVVVVIGILVAVAYPAYQDQIRKTRRKDAQGALMGLANAMERHFTENSTYRGASPGSGSNDTGAPGIFPSEAPLDGNDKYYDLSIISATASTYILRATPKNAQSGDGYLELSATGARGWDRNDDGDTDDAGESSWD